MLSSVEKLPHSVINLPKLFRSESRCFYTPYPDFLHYHPDLKDDDRRVAVELIKQMQLAKICELEISQEFIASRLGKSVCEIRRSIANLIAKGVLIAKRGGRGACTVYAFVYNPDLNLDPDQIVPISDLKTLKTMQSCAVKKRTEAVKTMQNCMVLNSKTMQNCTYDRATLHGQHDRSFKEKKPKEEKEGMAMPALANDLDADRDLRFQIFGSDGSENGKAARPAQIQSASVEQASAQQPQSKHSLETCLKFAYSEKERKGTIVNPKRFADSCNENGRQDGEIDDWLKKRAELFVGGEPPKSIISGAQPQPIEAASAQPKGKLPSFRDDSAQELIRQLELDRRREEAFNALPFGERQSRIDRQIDTFFSSELADKYRRMPRETLIEKAAYEAQNEIALPGEFKAEKRIRFFSRTEGESAGIGKQIESRLQSAAMRAERSTSASIAVEVNPSAVRVAESATESRDSESAASGCSQSACSIEPEIEHEAASESIVASEPTQTSASTQTSTQAMAAEGPLSPFTAAAEALQGKEAFQPAQQLQTFRESIAADSPYERSHTDSKITEAVSDYSPPAALNSSEQRRSLSEADSDCEASRPNISGCEWKNERRPSGVIRSADFKQRPATAEERRSIQSAERASADRSSADRKSQARSCGISAKAEEIAMGLNRELNGRPRLPFLDFLEEVKSRLFCNDPDEVGIALSPILKKIWKSGRANGPP